MNNEVARRTARKHAIEAAKAQNGFRATLLSSRRTPRHIFAEGAAMKQPSQQGSCAEHWNGTSGLSKDGP